MNRLLVGDQNRPQLPPSPGSREIPTRRSNFNCRVPEYLAILQPAAPPVMAGRGHLARQNFRMRACSGGKLLPDATFLARRGRFPLWRRMLGSSHGINSAIAQAKTRLEKRRGRTEGETEEAKVAIRWYFMYSYLWYCCFCLRLLSIPHGCVICRLQPRCGRRGESTRSQRAQASCGVVVINFHANCQEPKTARPRRRQTIEHALASRCHRIDSFVLVLVEQAGNN